ncbi:MAG: phosphoglucomutase (alpha-D-glucose-1,6-bisphosphate-dependent) [Candidatus Margulisbacteria bacterium]|jgi:phosphoglucomutase|nr:phosphoglucomutase (alpha-D-glucose-1,6-bisphosphate-dependent) [Candidatus Margulisiibacteriota bacterium]
MTISPLAGKKAPASILINVQSLRRAYYETAPGKRVEFGTSGHRGSALNGSFNEPHIAAVCQAIAEYRHGQNVTGPLFLGMDSHALSEPAMKTALEVLAANRVEVMAQLTEDNRRFTPTPAISHAILSFNRGRTTGLADGVIITPSHNPPTDGGIKYNPPHGGPADVDATGVIEKRANQIMAAGNREVNRLPYEAALTAGTTHQFDYVTPYVNALGEIIDMAAIRAAGLRIGADTLGGTTLAYWGPIADKYGLDITILHPEVDLTFGFMTVDWDGKIRMDCSSPYAMASLIELKNKYDIAFGNDVDADRHGIVTQSRGLLNPNHYLSVAIDYLFRGRTGWRADAVVGKTLVSSSLIDRVARGLGRKLSEVPVGFKWFVPGLIDGSCGFGGEESAGASFLKKDGSVWTTDKDGLILSLLAAEITARTEHDPGVYYQKLTERYGAPVYARIDAAATPEEKAKLKKLSPDQVAGDKLAGDQIVAKLTRAPGNDAPIGGLKVVTEQGWFAARPSGTEDVYKLYAESFKGPDHLQQIQAEARAIVAAALK